MKRYRIYWLVIFLLLGGVLLRTLNLMEIPMMSDEVRHIGRAQNIINGVTFDGLDQNKWLWGYVLTIFNPTGPEAGWIARYFNVLWAAVSIASIVTLGRLLDKPRTGLLAAFMYTVVPLAVFHERQALVDPMMTALTTLSMVATIAMVKRPKWHHALLLALTLTGARLVKPAMLPFLLLPLVAVVLYGLLQHDDQPPLDALKRLTQQGWLKDVLTPTVMWAAALAVTLGITAVIYSAAREQGIQPRETHSISLSNTVFIDADYEERFDKEQPPFHIDILNMAKVVVLYNGWVVVAGIVMACVWAVATGERWRATLYLIPPAIIFMVVPLIANRPTGSGEIASRYLLINESALVVLAAIGIGLTLDHLADWQPAASRWLAVAALMGIFVPNFWDDVLLITEPRDIEWAPYDSRVYFRSPTSGYPFEGLMTYMRAELDKPDIDRIHALGNRGTLRWLQSNIGPRSGEIKSVIEDSDSQRYQIALWLTAGDEVYVLEKPNEEDFAVMLPGSDRMAYGPNNTRLELVHEWRSYNAQEYVFKVIGADDLLADEIYRQLGDEPEFMGSDYDGLAGAVNLSPAQTILLYPHNHAPMLQQRTEKDARPLPLTYWPLTEEAVSSAFDSVDFADDIIFGLVTYDPPSTDPERNLARYLLENTYPLGSEQWFGLLNYQQYVTGPQPDMQPIDARYEGVIALESGDILDEQITAGSPVRMAFQWRSDEPVQDSFFVFTHIVDGDGNLIAQHDGVPGHDLLPMTAWEPGESITDRYAVYLPGDVPRGTYSVRVGVYNPASGLRLRVTEGSDTPDFVAVGQIEVVPAE